MAEVDPLAEVEVIDGVLTGIPIDDEPDPVNELLADRMVSVKTKAFDPHQPRDPHTGEWIAMGVNAPDVGGGSGEVPGAGELANAREALRALLPEGTEISRLDVPSRGYQINRLVLHRPGYDEPHAFEGGAPRDRPGEGQHIGHLTWHSDTGLIQDVEVEPEYKRRGIATAMLRLARAQAEAEGTARPQHSENLEPEGAAWARATPDMPDEPSLKWRRVASGDYETEDGWRLWQVPGIYPPAWNVEDPEGNLVVDGAATMRDARALVEEHRKQDGKRFDPHQPRDPRTGQWVDIPGRGYGLRETVRGPSGGLVAAPRRGSGGRDLPDVGGAVFSSPSLTPRTYQEFQESQRRQRERLGERARRVAFADPRTVAPREQVNVRARDVFVKAAADRAFGSIEEVHGYGPPLPEEPLSEITTNSQISAAADFDYHSREIRVNGRRLSHADTPVVGQVPESPTEKTTAQGAHYITHELGHALDRALAGPGGSFTAGTGWSSAEEGSAAKRVLDVANDSEAVGRIRSDAELSSSLRSYLLDPTEIFARAYAQYIALRSGDQGQQKEVAELAGYTDEPIWQWGEEDFEPIAQTFDEMFEELGWT